MKIALARRTAEAALAAAGIEDVRLEAELLIGYVSGHDRIYLHAHPEADIVKPDDLEQVLDRRARLSEPLSYILGFREFYGRAFRVAPGVLIPRQDTEVLVESALEAVDRGGVTRVVDFGCGSGCIGITLKLERPFLTVTLLDISEVAATISRVNGTVLDAAVEIVQADGFEHLAETEFDLIVSNPPYIAESEALPREVQFYEPPEALYGGRDGLDFYRGLSSLSLKPGVQVWVEIGHTQLSDVEKIFGSSGWSLIERRKDLAGRDRVAGFWQL